MINIHQINQAVKQTPTQLISPDFENCIQLAIYYQGQLVTDLSLGNIVGEGQGQVTSDTLFPVCSTS